MKTTAFDIPVTLIFFNRPDTTAEVFAKIRKAAPTKLYLVSDAPRTGNEEDVRKVAECRKLVEEGVVAENPLKNWIGAISGGVIDGEVVIDLDYEKDSRADTDFNFVFSENGNIIELQGTAERVPLDEDRFFELLNKSRKCVKEIIDGMKSTAGFTN